MRFKSIDELPAAWRAQLQDKDLQHENQQSDPHAGKLPEMHFRPYHALLVGVDETTLKELNKTERRYYEILLANEYFTWIGVKAFRFRLAANTHYTPDFQTLDKEGVFSMIDTKGGHTWEDAQLKMKMAAHLFPFFRWVRADVTLATRTRGEVIHHLVFKA